MQIFILFLLIIVLLYWYSSKHLEGMISEVDLYDQYGNEITNCIERNNENYTKNVNGTTMSACPDGNCKTVYTKKEFKGANGKIEYKLTEYPGGGARCCGFNMANKSAGNLGMYDNSANGYVLYKNNDTSPLPDKCLSNMETNVGINILLKSKTKADFLSNLVGVGKNIVKLPVNQIEQIFKTTNIKLNKFKNKLQEIDSDKKMKMDDVQILDAHMRNVRGDTIIDDKCSCNFCQGQFSMNKHLDVLPPIPPSDSQVQIGNPWKYVKQSEECRIPVRTNKNKFTTTSRTDDMPPYNSVWDLYN